MPEEKVDVIDAGHRVLKLPQMEENTNKQMLRKILLTQGKYDAAFTLPLLSVKLPGDHGLRYAKNISIAHIDVTYAFIHVEDLKNAEKHLPKALAIHIKSIFSCGKAQLGDVHHSWCY